MMLQGRPSPQASASQPTPGQPTPVGDTVKTIATEVQRADASLHDVVFVHEIAIARSLAKPMTKLIAMVAACGVGCSFIGVRGPPSPLPEHGLVTCSDSYVAPIVDSVVTALGVLLLVSAAQPCNGDTCTGGLLVIPGVALALPYGISALYGTSKVSSCNAANGPQRRREVAEDTAALARAENLTNAAVLAARAGDCATVKLLDAQVQGIDPKLHETFFHDPAITRCLTTIEPPPAPYCFDETTDDKVTTTCMPSEAECHHALEMLPLGSATTTCVAKPP